MRRESSPASGPDLRLAGSAVGAWLAALAALHLTPAQGAGIAVCAGMLAAVIWYRARRADRERYALLVALALLLGVVSGAAATAARTYARDAPSLAALVHDRATVSARIEVSDDPRRPRRGRARNWLTEARLTRLRTAGDSPRGQRLELNVRVLVIGDHPRWRGLLPGQQVSVTGRLVPPRDGDLRAAVLSVPGAPRLRGEPPLAQRAAGSLRAGLRRAAEPLPDEPGGLLPGLAIGDVSRMERSVEENFRTAGMTHLTAVSGSNLAIVCGLILLLAGWCRAGPVTSAALALLALVGFVILVRPSPSVLRAAVMGGLALVALASGRPRAALPGLAATVYLLVVFDPGLAADPGFALSVLATTGLLLLAPRWRDALRARGVPSGVAEALAVPTAAQVACAPVIAAMTGTVSLSAIPANLLAAPAVAPATVLGAAAAAISPASPGAAEFLVWLGSWPAYWLVLVARWGAGISGATAPWPAGTAGGLLLAATLAGMLVLTRHRTARRLLTAGVVAVVLGVGGVRTVAPGWPPPGWRFVACDVGQGDALVIRSGDGQALAVDVGPAPAAVDSCLRRLAVDDLPLLVLSHFHADHVDGLTGAMRHRSVGALVVPEYREPAGASTDVARAAAASHVPVVPVGAGWRYRIGDATVTVLAPEHTEVGTRSDPNHNSLVLQVTMPGLSLLLTGDAETERQQALLARGVRLRADVLKVAHHGSAYQDHDFVAAVDPAIAVVSVGADNTYGHPSPTLLRRLTGGGARVLRTDRGGDIAVAVASGGLTVARRGRPPGDHPP